MSAKDGKVMLAKIDIDEHTELAMDYEVRLQMGTDRRGH